MDTFFPEWNTEVEPSQREHTGVNDELLELVWQNGEVVLRSQPHRKPSYDAPNDDTDSWIHCPIDESFEKEFLADLSSKTPSSSNPIEARESEGFDTSDHNLGGTRERGDPEMQRQGCNQMERDEICRCSVMATGSRRCGSNHDLRKRKIEDVEETECRNGATESESAARKRSRRNRVAEVNNLSERKRRDRINEKLRALQELIPHSNKSGKASMLDDAIRYMKSLQLQLQLMRMRSEMAQMMLPGMQPYLSRLGMNIGLPMLPVYQNLMHPSNQPTIGQGLVLNPVNYPNQMQNPGFLEPYANYMGFRTMQNTSLLTNMFNFVPRLTQQNRVIPQPSNGNGSTGWTAFDNVPSAK